MISSRQFHLFEKKKSRAHQSITTFLLPVMAPPSDTPVVTKPSSSFPQIGSLTEQAKIAFGLMLEGTRESSREPVTLGQRRQIIEWITLVLPQ